ncbi:basic membrane protein A [Thermocatellispora tengchongensis]|uniref:Basic membrane protein A n=1 Tax=Thermocatellispora tengchongensis TaxID=1073253 RepID=A0A840NZ52_9ACTN|nr:BMP family ABC transporter substrate-binding protein [Thermocatellispora tengchongensis]MBB5130983.1 basic membrane protein A [Thermocatellispora tengchongensis]
MNNSARAAALAIFVAPALLLAACGTNDTSGNSSTATAKKGQQPDVNGDGKVVIGVLSNGDTHDNGYFQSFVDEANVIARANGWEMRTIDKINVADGANQARNLCRQRVDLIAVGAQELKDALAAAPEPVCANTQWYVNGGGGVEQTKWFSQSVDKVNQTLYTAGYAAGLLMEAKDVTKAGYITGPELDFSIQAAKAFEAGIKAVVPKAELLKAYTGDFEDSAKAKEAYTAQKAKGVKLVYPYLGGATDAVTQEANKDGVMTLTPGTDRCQDTTIKYDISVIFNPGSFFAAALQDFQKGQLKMGVTREWIIGKDPVPTLKICKPEGDQQTKVNQLMKDIGDGKFDVDAAVDGK